MSGGFNIAMQLTWPGLIKKLIVENGKRHAAKFFSELQS